MVKTHSISPLSFVTVEILVAHLWVGKVKDPVGLLAPRVNARRALLHKLTRAAIDIVRQHALLPVGHRVVEEQALRTEDLVRRPLAADVVLVALLRVRKLAIVLWAFVVGGRHALQVLAAGGGHGRQEEEEEKGHNGALLLGRSERTDYAQVVPRARR